MAWKIFFALKPGAPAIFVHNGVKFNLRNPNFPLVKLAKAYKSGCKYLELTDRGRAKFAVEFGRIKLPNQLPTGIEGRNIMILDSDGEETFETGLTGSIGRLIDESGSGTGDGGKIEMDLSTPELVIDYAEVKGLISRKGTSFEYNGKKYGTKAILKQNDIIDELRALIEEQEG
jgi:hypothetical protein